LQCGISIWGEAAGVMSTHAGARSSLPLHPKSGHLELLHEVSEGERSPRWDTPRQKALERYGMNPVSHFSPCTTRSPRLTCVSEGKDLRRLLDTSKPRHFFKGLYLLRHGTHSSAVFGTRVIGEGVRDGKLSLPGCTLGHVCRYVRVGSNERRTQPEHSTVRFTTDSGPGELRARCGLVPLPEVMQAYSITRSARTRIEVGSVTPSFFAVLILSTVSNFVACSTGMSAGVMPLKTLCRNTAPRAHIA